MEWKGLDWNGLQLDSDPERFQPSPQNENYMKRTFEQYSECVTYSLCISPLKMGEVYYDSNKLLWFVSGPDLSHSHIQGQLWYLLACSELRLN